MNSALDPKIQNKVGPGYYDNMHFSGREEAEDIQKKRNASFKSGKPRLDPYKKKDPKFGTYNLSQLDMINQA